MNKILIETSARHVHLSSDHIEKLFGKGYQLTIKKELSQPGQFACNERVTIRGPKNEIKNVSILGPARKASQVEVSATDARTLGLSLPVRESGDISGTPGVTLIGPAGEVELDEGAIVAKRHIHLTPDAAEKFGVTDKQVVSVRVVNDSRSLIFGDVVIRVSPSFSPAMHIDTDEANAGSIVPNSEGEIIL